MIMAEEQMIVIECPKCGLKTEFVVFDVLNSQVDYFEKQQLLNDTLFECKCEKCNFSSSLLYELVYHDVENNVMVYLVDAEHIDGVYTGLALADRAYEKAGIPRRRNRIVTCPHRFREKAIIFDEGLDDRIIEIMKIYCLDEITENMENINVDEAEVFFCVVDGTPRFEIYCGERTIFADIPDGLYDHIKLQFSELLADDPDIIVDDEWALGVLEDNGDDGGDGNLYIQFE
jgi:hypothetical protein